MMILLRKNFENIPDKLKPCLKFIEEYHKKPLAAGCYDLPTGGFVNVCEYRTDAEENCTKETHRKYIDVHYMVSGTELAKQEFIDNVSVDFYDEKNDYVAVSGEFHNAVVLNPGDLFIAYPYDAHLTRVSVEEESDVIKLIFKIPV